MQTLPRLYLVRHGRSTHNDSSDPRPLLWDAPLHPKGVRQAALLRERLEAVPLDLCVASPLTRALQTALVALGAWAGLAPGVRVATPHGEATVVAVAPLVQPNTVRAREAGTSLEPPFDALAGAGGLGPGARVRLRALRGLPARPGEAEAGAPATVVGGTAEVQPLACEAVRVGPIEAYPLRCAAEAAVLRCPGVAWPEAGAPATVVGGTAEVQPLACEAVRVDSIEACPLRCAVEAAALRCPVVAWPEASEQLCNSDDLGSPVATLRQRFPPVDFSALPPGDGVWWYSDLRWPASASAAGCRECWAKEDYQEPDDEFEARIAKLVERLQLAVADGHRHVAVFAHYWVLEELWRVRLGRRRRFDNAELAIVEVRPCGTWREVEGTSSDSESVSRSRSK